MSISSSTGAGATHARKSLVVAVAPSKINKTSMFLFSFARWSVVRTVRTFLFIRSVPVKSSRVNIDGILVPGSGRRKLDWCSVIPWLLVKGGRSVAVAVNTWLFCCDLSDVVEGDF